MKRSLIKTASLPFLLLILLTLGSGVASAAEKLVPKVDNFIVFLDYSGSMAMTHEQLGQKKLPMAQEAITSMVNKVPTELSYTGGLYTFAPYGEVLPMSNFQAGPFANAVNGINTDIPIFLRRTPMGDGLYSLANIIGAQSGKTAVIVVSDGLNNYGSDPISQAQSIYRGNDNVCFHILSVADKPEGQATLDAIAKLAGCTEAVKYANVMDDAAMAAYVKKIFYDVVQIEEKKPEPAAPKEDPCAQTIVFRTVQFDFDSSKIRADMTPVLDEIAAILKETPCSFVVAGHTCSIGTDEWNQGLSERRAASVLDYLLKQGVPASALMTAGFGEKSPKYDNGTLEGRRLNRRVEINMQ